MISESEYDDIRPYCDSEVAEVIGRLIKNDKFINFALQLFPDLSREKIEVGLSQVKSVDDFQSTFIVPVMNNIIKNTTKGISVEGLDQLDPNGNYLFISDHRDIILDSALLNILLYQNKFSTTEIAIGSNLLIRPWISDLVKLNKSFVVKRNSSVRDMLVNSTHLSSYIRYAINEKKSSVWIAQREGRTKDGDDRTQQSLLKMLQMGGNKTFSEHFKALKIVPVAISYEYEPCDGLKTRELYQKETDEGFSKTPKDDLLSMLKGLTNEKGRVHFGVGKPISEMLDVIEEMDDSRDKFKALADLIDYKIHKNFKLWPDNYIAFDILNKTDEYRDKYTDDEKELFLKHMDKKIGTIEGSKERLREIFFEIYANPVKNQIELTKPDFILDSNS